MFDLKLLTAYWSAKMQPHINKYKKGFAAVLSCGVFVVSSLSVCAVDTEANLEANRALPVQSNQVENWPQGPTVGAESAILMEAETGTILYAKNIHTKQYPASTTKILTTLIASELCESDEIVTFSRKAVFDTPRDSSHIAMDVGQAITMEQCLNAILIRSANEVSFAVAEHITNTTDWSVFAEMMNERAAELGALHSNFVNPNGLPDENHYTTCYDLAMIGRAFFANEMLCNITLTRRLDIPASDTLPHQKLELNNMAIIPTGEYAYDGIVGCKTGYTDAARSCLISCAERDGMRLICVVMRDEAPYQYKDTISLLDYGFSNFEKVIVSESNTKYNIDNTGIFYSGNDIFGNSKPILSLNEDDFVVLPNTATIDETDTRISYETNNANQAAVITYSYHGTDIGNVRVNFTKAPEESYDFESLPTETPKEQETEESIIFINVVKILIGLAVIAALIFFITLSRVISRNYQFTGKRSRRQWRTLNKRRQKQSRRRRKAKRPNRFRDYDF